MKKNVWKVGNEPYHEYFISDAETVSELLEYLESMETEFSENPLSVQRVCEARDICTTSDRVTV